MSCCDNHNNSESDNKGNNNGGDSNNSDDTADQDDDATSRKNLIENTLWISSDIGCHFFICISYFTFLRSSLIQGDRIE